MHCLFAYSIEVGNAVRVGKVREVRLTLDAQSFIAELSLDIRVLGSGNLHKCDKVLMDF